MVRLSKDIQHIPLYFDEFHLWSEYLKSYQLFRYVIGISWITDSSANEKEVRRFMKENKVLAIVPDTTAQKVENIHTDLD